MTENLVIETDTMCDGEAVWLCEAERFELDDILTPVFITTHCYDTKGSVPQLIIIECS